MLPLRSDDRLTGAATFNLAGYRHPLLAAILSAEHAIGVRNGCFCAQPLITRLLGISDAEVDRLVRALRAGSRPALPGAVRASIGLGTRTEDIDLFVGALNEIARSGPRARYLYVPEEDEYRPAQGHTRVALSPACRRGRRGGLRTARATLTLTPAAALRAGEGAAARSGP
jgi:hypothetical protein